jgi:hypothetical protein
VVAVLSVRGAARGRAGVVSDAAFALPPSQLGGERVEVLVPEPAEAVEPLVDLLQRRGLDGI